MPDQALAPRPPEIGSCLKIEIVSQAAYSTHFNTFRMIDQRGWLLAVVLPPTQ